MLFGQDNPLTLPDVRKLLTHRELCAYAKNFAVSLELPIPVTDWFIRRFFNDYSDLPFSLFETHNQTNQTQS